MSFLESVLQRTKKLERLLAENYQAEGKGLHEKTTSVEHYLDESVVKQIRFIASVRNNLVHRDGYIYDPGDEDGFLDVCDEVIASLVNNQFPFEVSSSRQPVIQGDYITLSTPLTSPYVVTADSAANRGSGTSRRHQTNTAQPKIGGFKKFLMILGGFWLFGFVLIMVFSFVIPYFIRQSLLKAKQPGQDKPQSVKVDSSILDSYTGQYGCKNYKITVSRTSDSLKTSSSMGTGILIAETETEFTASNYSNGFNGRMIFAKNQAGKVANLIIVTTPGSREQCRKIK